MLVDVDTSLSDGDAVVQAVLDRFRKMGLITGMINEDCVLGGAGYRPGPAVPDLYELEENEGRFWEMLTCGVEPSVGRWFNEYALGPVFEGLNCPSCSTHIASYEAFGDAIFKAIGEWAEQSGPALTPCPVCKVQLPITEWRCKPPLGFGNVSFRFWNWPPLGCTSWKVDIAGIVREVTGHTIVHTYGHL